MLSNNNFIERFYIKHFFLLMLFLISHQPIKATPELTAKEIEVHYSKVFRAANGYGDRFISHGDMERDFFEFCSTLNETSETKPNVLVVGCADGRIPYKLFSRFESITIFANDFSQENMAFLRMVKQTLGKKRGKRLKLIPCDVTNIVHNNSFKQCFHGDPLEKIDAIYVANVLHFMTPYEVYQNLENYLSLLKPEGLLFIQTHVLSPRVSQNTWDDLFNGNKDFTEHDMKTGTGSFFLGYIISQFYKENGIPYPGFFESKHYGNIKGLFCNKNFFNIEFDQFIEDAHCFGFNLVSAKSWDLENYEYKETESLTGIGTLGIFTFQKPKTTTDPIDVSHLFEKAERLSMLLDEFYSQFDIHSFLEIKRYPLSSVMLDIHTMKIHQKEGYEEVMEFKTPFFELVRK